MSPMAMFWTACEAIIPIGTILVIITVMRRRRGFSWKALGVGVLIFIVFSRVLEAILHLIVLNFDHTTSTYFTTHPIAFAIYGALAAGVFEEVGRYLGFKFLLKRFRTWTAGIAYGLGHGGVEAFFVGTVLAIETMAFGALASSGKMPANMPVATAQQILALVHQPAYFFALGTFERLMAICLQVALSLVVLYGVNQHRIRYLFLAIFLHAIVDFFPGLYLAHVISLPIVELLMLLAGGVSIIVVVRSRNWFVGNDAIQDDRFSVRS